MWLLVNKKLIKASACYILLAPDTGSKANGAAQLLSRLICAGMCVVGREGKVYRMCLGSESLCAGWERAQVRWGKRNSSSDVCTDALLTYFRGRCEARRGRTNVKGSFSVLTLFLIIFILRRIKCA